MNLVKPYFRSRVCKRQAGQAAVKAPYKDHTGVQQFDLQIALLLKRHNNIQLSNVIL